METNMKRAFTLIELIVVIAVIAILALILVPQVTGYIHDSQEVVCESNFRTIEMEYYRATVDNQSLMLSDYLDSLSDEEKDVCSLCDELVTDGISVACAGTVYNNSASDQYIDMLADFEEYKETELYKNSKPWNKDSNLISYFVDINNGTLPKLNDEQKQELIDSGYLADNSDTSGHRVTPDSLYATDFYYKPVMVGDDIALLVTDNSNFQNGLGVTAIYYEDEFYYAHHGWNDKLTTVYVGNNEDSVMKIIDGVNDVGIIDEDNEKDMNSNDDEKYIVIGKSTYWTK